MIANNNPNDARTTEQWDAIHDQLDAVSRTGGQTWDEVRQHLDAQREALATRKPENR